MAQPDWEQKLAEFRPQHQEPFPHNLVDGVMVPPFITQQRVDELKTLKLRPDDVFVVSYPKSGIYIMAMMIPKFEPGVEPIAYSRYSAGGRGSYHNYDVLLLNSPIHWVPGGRARSLCPLATRGQGSQFVSIGYKGAGLAVCVHWLQGGWARSLCPLGTKGVGLAVCVRWLPRGDL